MFRKITSSIILISFITTTVVPPSYAQAVAGLPLPGTMVSLSKTFEPALIQGLKIDTENPFKFEFILNTGDDKLTNEQIRTESEKMIKYFLAALTIPEEDLWVNLSPLEKDRITPENLGITELGKDLLAQDYLLKQIMSSVTYPEEGLGEKFWKRVHAKATEMYGTVDLDFDTFTKVWIVPDRAEIFEVGQTAYVIDSRLKVMLDRDYLAEKVAGSRLPVASKDQPFNSSYPSTMISPTTGHRSPATGDVIARQSAFQGEADNVVISGKTAELRDISAEITREIIIPEIEREINTAENFTMIRQIYQAVILAGWYKERLKDSVLSQMYVDKGKVKGVDVEDKNIKEKIWAQYVEALDKGVYNYIREDYDPAADIEIPRKYFSGGLELDTTSLKTKGRNRVYTLQNRPPSALIVPFQRRVIEDMGDGKYRKISMEAVSQKAKVTGQPIIGPSKSSLSGRPDGQGFSRVKSGEGFKRGRLTTEEKAYSEWLTERFINQGIDDVLAKAVSKKVVQMKQNRLTMGLSEGWVDDHGIRQIDKLDRNLDVNRIAAWIKNQKTGYEGLEVTQGVTSELLARFIAYTNFRNMQNEFLGLSSYEIYRAIRHHPHETSRWLTELFSAKNLSNISREFPHLSSSEIRQALFHHPRGTLDWLRKKFSKQNVEAISSEFPELTDADIRQVLLRYPKDTLGWLRKQRQKGRNIVHAVRSVHLNDEGDSGSEFEQPIEGTEVKDNKNNSPESKSSLAGRNENKNQPPVITISESLSNQKKKLLSILNDRVFQGVEQIQAVPGPEGQGVQLAIDGVVFTVGSITKNNVVSMYRAELARKISRRKFITKAGVAAAAAAVAGTAGVGLLLKDSEDSGSETASDNNAPENRIVMRMTVEDVQEKIREGAEWLRSNGYPDMVDIDHYVKAIANARGDTPATSGAGAEKIMRADGKIDFSFNLTLQGALWHAVRIAGDSPHLYVIQLSGIIREARGLRYMEVFPRVLLDTQEKWNDLIREGHSQGILMSSEFDKFFVDKVDQLEGFMLEAILPEYLEGMEEAEFLGWAADRGLYDNKKSRQDIERVKADKSHAYNPAAFDSMFKYHSKRFEYRNDPERLLENELMILAYRNRGSSGTVQNIWKAYVRVLVQKYLQTNGQEGISPDIGRVFIEEGHTIERHHIQAITTRIFPKLKTLLDQRLAKIQQTPPAKSSLAGRRLHAETSKLVREWTDKGFKALQYDDVTQAKFEFEKALRAGGEDILTASVRAGLAWVAFQEGDVEKGIERLTEAQGIIDQNIQRSKNQNWLSEVIRKARYKLAEAYYVGINLAEDHRERLEEGLTHVGLSQYHLEGSQIKTILQQAWLMKYRGDLAQTEQLLLEVVAINPGHQFAQGAIEELGGIYTDSGRRDEAIQIYETQLASYRQLKDAGIKIDNSLGTMPDRIEQAATDLAQLLIQMGDFGKSLEILSPNQGRDLHKDLPFSNTIVSLLIDTLHGLKRYAAAASFLREGKSLEIKPFMGTENNRAALEYHLAVSLYLSGDKKSARAIVVDKETKGIKIRYFNHPLAEKILVGSLTEKDLQDEASDAKSSLTGRQALAANQDNVQGGVDFESLNILIKRDQNGEPLAFNLQNSQIIDIEGLKPVIISITEMTLDDLPQQIAYIREEDEEELEQLAVLKS